MATRKKIVVLTGAGISKESGIPTFRGSDGLWEGHKITDVASPGGWERDPDQVLAFYNLRRKAMRQAQPNAGHTALVELEAQFDVQIITQNIDDLHERAGSTKVLHLHGEITKARSTADENLVYPIAGDELNRGDLCEKGSQLRPHIVWFEEDVPMFGPAVVMTAQADIVIIVGTSMVVYPANTLVEYAPEHAEIFLVDPNVPEYNTVRRFEYLTEAGSTGVPRLVERLLSNV